MAMNVPAWKALLDLPWLSWSIGGLIATTGLILLYRALFADRPRGRRRCPKCWYDMRGTPSLRCPECGHTPKSERRLRRTRCYWRWATVATFCVFGGTALPIVPQVRRDGWMSFVPTTVLLLLSDPASKKSVFKPNAIDDELAARNAAATLNGWQWDYVFRNLSVVRHREAWPASVPLLVEFQYPAWLAVSAEAIARLSPDTEPIALEYDGFPNQCFALGNPPIGTSRTRVLCTFSDATRFGRSTFARASAPALPWKFEMWQELPIRVVDSMDEAMSPLRGSQWDARIRAHVRISFFRRPWRANHGPATSDLIGLSVMRDADPGLSTLATAFSISVRRHARGAEFVGADIGNYRFGPRMLRWTRSTLPDGSSPDNYLVLEPDTINQLRWEPDWYIVLRGDPELALRDWDKSAYWDGQITLTPDEVWIEGRDPVEELQSPRVAKSP